MKKTQLSECLEKALQYGVPIYGDTKFRGDCPKEDSELATFHQWVKFNYPQLEPLCFHVPNEGISAKGGSQFSYAAKRHNMGVKPRLADWICVGGNNAPPFMLEMKRVDIQKSLSSSVRKQHFIEQVELLGSQSQFGAFVCVTLGATAAKEAWLEYINQYWSEL